MMNERLIHLAERRASLVARAEHQRRALAEAAGQWQKPLAMADHGISFISRLAQYPALMAGATALIVWLRPRVLLKLTRHSWLAWRIARLVRVALTR
jgi:YqjK-like protein